MPDPHLPDAAGAKRAAGITATAGRGAQGPNASRSGGHRILSAMSPSKTAQTGPWRAAYLAAAAAVVGLTLSLSACGTANAPKAPSNDVGTRVDYSLPSAVLDAPLTTQSGQPVTLRSFRDKVLVISDTMTLCQETCPLDTATVAQTARDVDKAGFGKDVELLSITVDPGRDTPARLAAYRALYAPAPQNWLALTGSAVTVNRFWTALGVYRQQVKDPATGAPRDWLTGKPLTYDIFHSDEVFFLDGRLHERFILEGPPHLDSAAQIPSTLGTFMDAQGHRNVMHPDAEAWTEPQALGVLGWLTGHRIA